MVGLVGRCFSWSAEFKQIGCFTEELSIVNEIGMLSCFSKTFVINEECDWSLVTELSFFDEIVFSFFKMF